MSGTAGARATLGKPGEMSWPPVILPYGRGPARRCPGSKKDGTFQPSKDGIIRPVPDYTGMKIGNRGERIRVKWKVNGGFFKLHILVDLDTRRILGFSDKRGEIQISYLLSCF